MTANSGKFIDRSPIICAAGKSIESNDNVAVCLQEYSLQDKVDALKHDGGIYDEYPPRIKYKLPPMGNTNHQGIYTEGRDVLNLPVRTRFQTLMNDLKETTYNSYWNKPIGKCRDPTGGLPVGVNPVAVTYGTPTKKETSLKDLVNPPKSVYEVLCESQVGHELYRKSHNDYNPSERIDRNFYKPPYDPNKRYGMHTTYDPRGIWVKCACDWYNKEPVVQVRTTQADMTLRRRPQLGKCLTPNENIKCVPEGHTFGDPSSHEPYHVEDLLKDPGISPCVMKKNFYKWLSSLNQLRLKIKKKDVFRFDVKSFSNKLLYYDQERSGWINKHLMKKIFECYQVNFESSSIDPLLQYLGILVDDKIYYQSFVDLLDSNKPMPSIEKVNDIPEKNLSFITTSQAMACDYLVMDNSYMPTAGVTSHQDSKGPIRAESENLGNETTAKTMINPSIYTNYGLTHADFCKPRSSETIRTLFEKAGYNFAEDTFGNLWQLGLEKDNTGKVCVKTFSNLLKEKMQPSMVKINQI